MGKWNYEPVFQASLDIEEQGYELFQEYMNGFNGWKVNRNYDVALQKRSIDYILYDPQGKRITLELKTERQNKYKNLFLEVFSNICQERRGWMATAESDVLVYGFLKERVLYFLDFNELQDWFFGSGAFIVDFHIRLTDFC